MGLKDASEWLEHRVPSPFCPPAALSPLGGPYLEVFDPGVDAGGRRLGVSARPGVRHDLDHLLQGVAHALEHGVLVEARGLAVRVSEACLQRERAGAQKHAVTEEGRPADTRPYTPATHTYACTH